MPSNFENDTFFFKIAQKKFFFDRISILFPPVRQYETEHGGGRGLTASATRHFRDERSKRLYLGQSDGERGRVNIEFAPRGGLSFKYLKK